MSNTDTLLQKFNDCNFTLSEEDILDLEKQDNGPVNNVISRIVEHCYGIKIYEDLTIEMFFIVHEPFLKGDIIRLNIYDPDYFQLLLHFCILLSNSYNGIDAFMSFNTFQKKLRSGLEKLGFFTVTDSELKQFEGKNAVMLSTSPKGIFKIDTIDSVQFYRDLFNNNYTIDLAEGRQYVYLMLNRDTSLIKIGTSNNPKYREKTLHSQEPNIFLIAYWSCNKNIEKKLHDKFVDKRIRGEWFRLTINELIELEHFMEIEICNDF
jgi:hypothetical protein